VAGEGIAVVVVDVPVARRAKQRQRGRLPVAGVQANGGAARLAGEALEPLEEQPGDPAVAGVRCHIEPLDLRAAVIEALDAPTADRTPVGVGDDEPARRRRELVGVRARPGPRMPPGVEEGDFRGERVQQPLCGSTVECLLAEHDIHERHSAHGLHLESPR
jgi:hypothetical protein